MLDLNDFMDFKVDNGEEGQETELPALNLLRSMGYEYKTNFEINKERKDHREALLYGRVRAAIKKLNDLDDKGVEDALRQIHEDSHRHDLDIVDANERVRIKLIGLSNEGAIEQPITVKQYGSKDVEYKTVKFFDFENPENNDFLVTNQFELQGLKTHIKADIVCFVNGIPLVVIECKKPSSPDYLKEAYESNLEKYQRMGLGFRKLFYYNHVIIATSDINARHGTVGALPDHYAKWTSLQSMTLKKLEKLVKRTPSAQDVVIAGMLDKKILLDMLKSFVIYETENNKKIKKIAKHQQYRVVTKAVDRLKHGKQIAGQGGVIWHTQGSGKSLSMVWFAIQLLFKFCNPPIVIITDRKQLDKQIHDTFKSCGFSDPIKAKNIKHLKELLTYPKGKTIMSTIQKFGEPDACIHTDERIIALVDEAHRTEYGWNAAHMRNSMPNAVFFAFSGTPIDKKNRSIFREFGPLVDKYSFEESKSDGVTLPVKHEGRMPDLFVEGGDSIDEIFNRVFSHLSSDKRAQIKKKYGTKSNIAEAPKRIREICKDLVKHYTTHIEPNGYKAMVVATSREAAVTYKKDLERIGAPKSKIIMTSEPDEVGRDGTSWKEYFLLPEEREREAERFKSPQDPTKILIVVDMLLVGYDVPILQVMYLDKGLKEHALLQAIARVNRLYDSVKTYGLVVDYIGISKNLQKALEIFKKDDIQSVFDTLDADMITLDLRHKELMSIIKELKDRDNSEIITAFESPDSQEVLEYAFKNFAKALDEVLPRKEAERYRDDFKFACKVRAMVRAYLREDQSRFDEYGKKVQQLIDDHVNATGISTLMNPREITYENFLVHAAKFKDSARTALVKTKTMQVIREHEVNNPGYYAKLREKIEKLIIDEKEKRLENANYFDLYSQVYQEAIDGGKITEEQTGIKDEFERAVFYLLKPELGDDDLCKKLAETITEEIKKEAEIPDWHDKLTVNNRIELAVNDNLPSGKLSKEVINRLSKEVLKLARYKL